MILQFSRGGQSIFSSFDFLFFDTKELGKNWHASENNFHDFAWLGFSMKMIAWRWPHIFNVKAHVIHLIQSFDL